VAEKGLLLASGPVRLYAPNSGSELVSQGPVVESEELKFPGDIAYRRIEALRSIRPELLSHCSESVLEGHQIQVQDHHVSAERLEADIAPDASKFGLGPLSYYPL
jgi:hypothetical protein